MPKFVIETGSKAGHSITVPQGVTILGRAIDCEYVVPDRRCSRRQCHVNRLGDQVTIQDLQSRHGTLVNGSAIDAPVILNFGDAIILGHTLLKFEDDDFRYDEHEEEEMTVREEEVFATVLEYKHELDEEYGGREKRAKKEGRAPVKKKKKKRRHKYGGGYGVVMRYPRTIRAVRAVGMAMFLTTFGVSVYLLIYGHMMQRLLGVLILYLAIQWVKKVKRPVQ